MPPLDPDKIREVFDKLLQSLRPSSHWRSPDRVHNLRTRSRRLEALLFAFTLDREPSGQRLLKSLARIRKRAGKVRDMDVIMVFATGLADGAVQPDLVQLLEQLAAGRAKAAHQLRSCIAKHGESTRHELKECRAQLRKCKAADWQKLEAGALARGMLLTSELSGEAHPTAANLHSYRIRLKRLRYTLQLAESESSPAVAALGKVTDAIGEWHDWSELLKIATKVLPLASGQNLSRKIRAIVSAKLRYALALSSEIKKQTLSGFDSHPAKKRPSSARPGRRALSSTTGRKALRIA